MENEQELQLCAKCPTPDKCAEANQCVLSAREPDINHDLVHELGMDESHTYPEPLKNWCECTICTDHES